MKNHKLHDIHFHYLTFFLIIFQPKFHLACDFPLPWHLMEYSLLIFKQIFISQYFSLHIIFRSHFWVVLYAFHIYAGSVFLVLSLILSTQDYSPSYFILITFWFTTFRNIFRFCLFISCFLVPHNLVPYNIFKSFNCA